MRRCCGSPCCQEVAPFYLPCTVCRPRFGHRRVAKGHVDYGTHATAAVSLADKYYVITCLRSSPLVTAGHRVQGQPMEVNNTKRRHQYSKSDKVEEVFSITVNGFVKPVHHRAADSGTRIHIFAWNTGLAIAYSAVLSILFFSLCVFNIHVNLILNDLCKFFLR